MSKRIICLLALSLIFGTGGAFSQVQNAPATSPEPTLWLHNGSVVYLIAQGASRTFYYKEPRPQMLEAGAHPGSLLFRGKSNNLRYDGLAYIFDRRCGQFPYHVSGQILDGYERVLLRGQAPRVGQDCRIFGYLDDALEFTLLKPPSATMTFSNAPGDDRDPPIEGYAFEYGGEPSHTVSSLGACVSSCQIAANCTAYVFFKSSRLCRLMTQSDAVLKPNFDAISGLNIHAQTHSVRPEEQPNITARGPKDIPSEPRSGATKPTVAPASTDETTLVPLEKEGGTYVVPVVINNAITLNFVLDSGAADVSIPGDVAMTLVRTGTLEETDFIGTQTYTLADGSTIPSKTFRIRSLRVGNRSVENVTGSIAPVQGVLLLGQSFLERFRSWSVDNARHALVLER